MNIVAGKWLVDIYVNKYQFYKKKEVTIRLLPGSIQGTTCESSVLIVDLGLRADIKT
jgi:hypothetical protein